MTRQNRTIRGLVLAAWLASVLTCPVHASSESAWTQDFEAAKAQAREKGKDLLIYFSGSDWCTTCQKLDQEVLGQPDFLNSAAGEFVLVQLDFPKTKALEPATKAQNERLQKQFTEKYRLQGYPTLYLATADGSPYAQTGYREGGVEAFGIHLAFLKRAQPMVDLGSQWIEDMSVAKAKAAYQGKDILMDFTGSDWCGWCIKLEDQVFSKDAFKDRTSNAFVFVKIDFPHAKEQPAHIIAQNSRLAAEYSAKYGFQGYPTLYLATPEGVPYGMAGYAAVTAQVYADALVEMHEDNVKKRTAATEEGEDS